MAAEHNPLAPIQLRAGTDPSRPLDDTRLLVVDGARLVDTRVAALGDHLSPGDLLVLNDSATLPASLHGTFAGEPIELRLATRATGPFGELRDADESFPRRWRAVLFGAGDWRSDTDARPAPPRAVRGERLRLGDAGSALDAIVVGVSNLSPRLVDIELDASGPELVELVYRLGRPVQYRHLPAPLALEHVQTPFASRPWSMEMPSTGRPLSWRLIDDLERRGVAHAFLTHAAGLSATGDPALDAALPLQEPYEIPEDTVARVREAKARGGRVVGVGTTVVRALEAASVGGALRAGHGVARLRIDRDHARRVVDAIVTGVHSPGESHFDLLGAFAAPTHLLAAHRAAAARGYLAHELGDLMLLR